MRNVSMYSVIISRKIRYRTLVWLILQAMHRLVPVESVACYAEQKQARTNLSPIGLHCSAHLHMLHRLHERVHHLVSNHGVSLCMHASTHTNRPTNM